MPIEAESAFFGSIAMSRCVEPFVSLSSGKGRAIIVGENDLTAVMIERGTAV
jgi:hypothetical protein